jgi:hypothetical protein
METFLKEEEWGFLHGGFSSQLGSRRALEFQSVQLRAQQEDSPPSQSGQDRRSGFL